MMTKIEPPIIAPRLESMFADSYTIITPSRFSSDITDVGLSSSYNSGLPYSMNVFTAISKSFSIKNIDDSSVKTKVLQILNALNESIVNIPNINNNADCYISKLHIVEQDDKSILIEWNFSNFRIGFVVCTPVEDSYYFLVSQNEESFVSKSEKIGNKINKLANEAVKYVVRNI
ncbi:MAG: hypothetical protein LBT84_06970 [Spirochaetia bacterium]|jgi:hypothetical protein|nr:hypothetical protein [Spirochaetia bacterium]